MKKIILLAAATIALASCDNNEDNQSTSNEAATITASIGESAITRASNAKWARNDSIGISSTVGESTGPFINFKYTTTEGDENFSGKPIFFYKPMTLTAYYPFTGTEGTAPGIDGKITANTGSDNQTKDNQPNIDFLWDSKTGVGKKDFSASENKVNFTFAHKMSKLTFTFQSSSRVVDDNDPKVVKSEGVDVGTMISYEIEGLGVDGTFDTKSGICAIDESKDRAGLKISFNKEATEMKEREMPSLIVFPQKNDNGFTLHITTDELAEGTEKQNYKCALRFTDNEIKAGYEHKFTIQVTRRGLIVGNLSIVPWVPADEKFITATIDGGDNEFKEN